MWTAGSATPERIELPRERLRDLWWSTLAARTISASVTRSAEHLAEFRSVPTSSDLELRSARTLFESERVSDAAIVLLERRRRAGLDRDDLRALNVQLAFAFAEMGDEKAGRIAIRDALERDPCLGVSAATSSLIRRLADPLRPRARCSSQRLTTVATRSLVPGLGQVTQRSRREVGLAVFTAVAGSFALAAAARSTSLAAYSTYQRFDVNDPKYASVPDVKVLDLLNQRYGAAESARRSQNRYTAAGAAVWSLAAVEAVMAEYRHSKRIEAVARYGEPAQSRLSFTFAPAMTGISASLSLTPGTTPR